MNQNVYPKWLRDIAALLPIKAQFVLTGNIRDKYLIDEVLESFEDALWITLSRLGYEGMLIWDRVDGLRAYPAAAPVVAKLSQIAHIDLSKPKSLRLAGLGKIIKRISHPREGQPPVALVIDYASRIMAHAQDVDSHEFFATAEKCANTAVAHHADESGAAFFNPVFWLTNRAADLPYWLTSDSERIRTVAVPYPDGEARRRMAHQLFREIPESNRDISAAAFSNVLANLTHNMSLTAISDIFDLALASGKPASEIDEAVQSYRVGDIDLESPWRSGLLRQNILDAENPAHENYIGHWVKGQKKAINKVFDILKRTSVGLTGAQSSAVGSRPRGVLFFAGPTGVGKTELAKSIARIVFGDQNAYKRFDMSEFSAEHSGERLIGAPPSYVGFDQGGELTNAVREQPFRVLLFDEIEKAHNKILDKFLQILEDGRLTDGRGDTVYFSESLIVFTSNVGISRERPDGSVEYLVSPTDSLAPDEYERIIMNGVKDYFRKDLRRPELLNRFGENIVVFSFITPDVGREILAKMIDNVCERVRDEHGLELKLSRSLTDQLHTLCMSDNLINGGRGIGSRLEEVFVNPLARLIFDHEPLSGELQLSRIEENDGIYELHRD